MGQRKNIENFFDQALPFAAGGATAQPFAALMPALLANINRPPLFFNDTAHTYHRDPSRLYNLASLHREKTTYTLRGVCVFYDYYNNRNLFVIPAKTMQKQSNVMTATTPEWIPLSRSFVLMLSRKKLFGWSFSLFLLTIILTWFGFQVTIDFIDDLSGSFMSTAPVADNAWGWMKYASWQIGNWLFLIVSRIVAFYFAFLLAYTLTTPGYAFLSAAAEKLYAGEQFTADNDFTLTGIGRDILEGLKIALFGIGVTIAALLVNFIPGLGQIVVVLLYTFYSTLMFIDYPASRRRWSLGEKIQWLRTHNGKALRIGLLPALLSMIPVINIFAVALLFPLLTIHATLNFSAIELAPHSPTVSTGGRLHGQRN